MNDSDKKLHDADVQPLEILTPQFINSEINIMAEKNEGLNKIFANIEEVKFQE